MKIMESKKPCFINLYLCTFYFWLPVAAGVREKVGYSHPAGGTASFLHLSLKETAK